MPFLLSPSWFALDSRRSPRAFPPRNAGGIVSPCASRRSRSGSC